MLSYRSIPIMQLIRPQSLHFVVGVLDLFPAESMKINTAKKLVVLFSLLNSLREPFHPSVLDVNKAKGTYVFVLESIVYYVYIHSAK